MTRWKTGDILDLIHGDKAPCRVPHFCQVNGPGSDYDTNVIWLTPKGSPDGEWISVSGFVTSDAPIATPNDCEIEMVMVSDGQDSRGGLNSADLNTCLLYAYVCHSLRSAGFSVVPQMTDYF